MGKENLETSDNWEYYADVSAGQNFGGVSRAIMCHGGGSLVFASRDDIPAVLVGYDYKFQVDGVGAGSTATGVLVYF